MQSIKSFSIKLIKSGLIVYLILAVFVFFHFYLISKTFVIDEIGNIRTAYSGYGDMPFHMTQVSKFGFGSLFDFNEPIFSGEKIRYSFLINYFSGVLLKFTDSWSFSMHLPTMLFMAGGYAMTFLVYKRILNRRWAALLAIIIFFLGSGVGGYDLLKDKLYDEDMAVSEFRDYLTDNNIFTFTNLKAVYPEQNTNWSSPLSLSFLHQRSFFMGLLLFSSFVYFLLFKIRESDKKRYLILAGIGFGLGPLGHYHSFIVMGIVAGFYLVRALMIKDYLYAKKVFIVGLIAGAIALPQVIYLLSGNSPDIISGDSSLIKYRFGWMTEAGGIGSVQYPPGEERGAINKFFVYLKFIWVNFGFILPLFLLALFLKRIRSRLSGLFWLAGIIFAVNQLFQFQPWDYDNNKILVYFAFFAAPIIVSLMVIMIGKLRYIGVIISAAVVSLVIFTGVVDMIPRYYVATDKMPAIFDKDAVSMAYFIRQNIGSDEIILSTTTHLNLVSSVAGRPTVVGFPGWLWTKGIDYTVREQELKAFYANPVANADVAYKYNTEYALIDPVAIYEWRVDKNFFDANFDLIFESGNYYLYKLR